MVMSRDEIMLLGSQLSFYFFAGIGLGVFIGVSGRMFKSVVNIFKNLIR